MMPARNSMWPDARVDALRRMVGEEALSLSAMGRELGISRGAVSMKLKRLGIVFVPPVRLPKVKCTHTVKAAPLLPITRADGSQVTLENVRDGECRFPCGDQRGGDLVLCGRKTKAGAVYCEAHRRIAYTRVKSKGDAP